MRNRILIFMITVIGLLPSCAVTYYQVVETKTSDSNNVQQNGSYLVYEDANCIVKYNFWASNGFFGFDIENKTEDFIYIDLDKTFYIRNGYAQNYFKNREWHNTHTDSKSSSSSLGNPLLFYWGENIYDLGYWKTGSERTITSSNTLVEKEDKIVVVPPHFHKLIYEYSIMNVKYTDCELCTDPTNNKSCVMYFTKENTPCEFSNFITYRVGNNEKENTIKNTFYISSITNFQQSNIIDYQRVDKCGNILHYKDATIWKIETSPNKFYIKYQYTY